MLGHRHLIIVLLSCFLIPLMFLRAQPVNHLLSVDTIVQYLPEDIRIQSAVKHGTSVFVVWGSTVAISDEQFRQVLYYQIVCDGQAIGTPRILHSKDAVPFNFVHVLVSGNGYRVLWNDRRKGQSEIYAQTLDRTGQKLGVESLVAKGSVTGLSTLDSAKNILLIYRAKQGPLVLNRQGEWSEPPLLQEMQSLPAVLSSDSSFSLIRDNTFMHYVSFLDSLPAIEFDVPPEDSLLAGTTALSRRPSGDYQLTFVTKGVPNYLNRYKNGATLRIVRKTFSLDNPTLRDRQELDSFFFGGEYLGLGSAYASGTERINVCNGQYHVRCSYVISVKMLGQPWNNSNGAWMFAVDQSDSITLLSNMEYDVGHCEVSNVDIHRLDSDSMSVVEIMIASGSALQLAVPVALLPEQRRHVQPALSLVNESMLVTWEQPDDGYRGVIYELVDLESDSSNTRFIRAFSAPHYGNCFARQLRTEAGAVVAQHCTSKVWTAYQKGWAQTWTIRHFMPGDDNWSRTFEKNGGYHVNGGRANERYTFAVAHDPDQQEMMTMLVSPHTDDVQLHEISRQGEERWSDTILNLGYELHTVLNFRGSRYAGITTNGIAYLYDGANIRNSVSLAPFNSETIFQRIPGGRVLQCMPAYNGRIMDVRLYDDQFQVLGRFSFELDNVYTGVDCAFSEIDSSFAIVTTTESGTTLTVLNKSFLPISTSTGRLAVNLPISAHAAKATAPFALFRSDTLFMVWEDHRRMYPDIYGAWFRPVDFVSSVPENSVQRGIRSEKGNMTVVPNPATEHVQLHYELKESGNVRIHMINSLGATVWSRSIEKQHRGKHVYEIPVAGLAEGMYGVVLDVSGTVYAHRNLIVLSH